MKIMLCILVLWGTTLTLGACSPDDILPGAEIPAPKPESPELPDKDDNDNTMTRTITITAGGAAFPATLADNAAAQAFVALLPMTAGMEDLNGNEKYYNLPQNLPTDTSRPGTIRTGDLLLFGSNTVVLFYETFSSSYSYTRLGWVDNPGALATALGRGNVSVTFEIAPITE